MARDLGEGTAKPANSAMEEATAGGDTRTAVPEPEPIDDTHDSEELEPTVVPQQTAVEDRTSTSTESGTVLCRLKCHRSNLKLERLERH